VTVPPVGLEPLTFVVFGGTGDLMERKLLPALFRVAVGGGERVPCTILGAARSTAFDDLKYREWARRALLAAGLDPSQGGEHWCDECLFYQSVKGDPASFRALAARLEALERQRGCTANRVYYLALPPEAVPHVIEGLGLAGLGHSSGWTRLVIEKPFGRDLDTAHELNLQVHRHFGEEQVFRIDHYLGKETVQNLLALRFANPAFESLWNRDRVESVQITVAEELGVADRAGYYDGVGAVRDMVQNHLAQLATLIAMEVPVAFDADDIRNEKVKVLRAVPRVLDEDVITGQYGAGRVGGEDVVAYRDEVGVAPASKTETFAALRLEVDNWRWQGVPFFLRTGKRLPRRLTQIVVVFRRAPVSLFGTAGSMHVDRNALAMTLQPDEGFDLLFDVKVPGQRFELGKEALRFRYDAAYGPLSDAYETLLVDIMKGDQTLFVRADEAEAAWRLFSPLVVEPRPLPEPYTAGSWGPEGADELLARHGTYWSVVQ
jgi:glucose-6-phosphate 1-dehydrogenase